MRKPSFVFIGIVIVAFSLMCCNPHDDYEAKFDILNKSDSSVYFTLSFSYPDTSLNSFNSAPNQWQKILAHDGKNETRSAFNINSTTLVYFFDAHTIETTPWDSIVKHYMILKRYDLTKDDMVKMNWIITYQ